MSIQPVGTLGAYAEVRTGYAEVYEGDELVPLMELSVKGGICAFEKKVSDGCAVVIGTDYICYPEAIETLMKHLGIEHNLSHSCEYYGIMMGMSKDRENKEKFLHVLNLDAFTKSCQMYYNGNVLFDGKEMFLGSRDGYMLPMNLRLGNYVIAFSTAEIYSCGEKEIIFRLTQPQDEIVFEGDVPVRHSEDYDIIHEGGRTRVVSKKDGRINEFLNVGFE